MNNVPNVPILSLLATHRVESSFRIVLTVALRLVGLTTLLHPSRCKHGLIP